ncbi:NADP-dependent oxidoreductase [Kineococcus esterisolvens]|uniref:NADP-dependent oxidoreductase n=1 Tax=unclassified Kineococcus TaxID=2621656 RepID=UPI003D7D25B8
MRVVEVSEPGGPDVLQVVQRPEPQPGEGEVVVAVEAAGVNPTDLAARQGMTVGDSARPPYVLGWDFAGTVVSVGPGAQLRPGRPVVGMVPWYAEHGRVGAYAERIAVPESWVLPRPDGLGAVEAATIPLNALTAAQLLDLLAPPPGADVLVTGASGAVGGYAVQLAAQAGHRVTAVAGTGDGEWVRGLGAAVVLGRDTDYTSIGTFGSVVDAVPVGEALFPAVAPGGTVLSTRPVTEAPAAAGITQRVMLVELDLPLLTRLVGEVAAGRLRTRVSSTFPLERAADAHRAAEEHGRRGKVVLEP